MVKGRVSKHFVDSLRVIVRGGAGGHGLHKFGGKGGKGGDVYFVASRKYDLRNIISTYSRRNITAEDGEDSTPRKIYGEPGRDKMVEVPVGVIVSQKDGTKIGELNTLGEKLMVVQGGAGGARDTKPPYNGFKGEERVVDIELKLIADVGLVGFPNAGKSTLLKAISRATPKIAAYAFTTLKPNLGVVEYSDLRQIKIADLPGLVEGASHNVGMGHRFLRHVERTSLILMMADITGFRDLPIPSRNCLETVIILQKELELYNKDLLEKPALLAVNKMDLPEAKRIFQEIKPKLKNLEVYLDAVPEELRPSKLLHFHDVVPISAKCSQESIEELKKKIRLTLDENHRDSVINDVFGEEMKLMKRLKKLNQVSGVEVV